MNNKNELNKESNSLNDLFIQHRNELKFQMPEELENDLHQKYQKKSAINWWYLIGSSLATACLTLLIAFQFGTFSARVSENEFLVQEVTAIQVRSLMAEHLADVVSTDKHTVKPWFEGRLDFAPDVRDFSESGYPLKGGRLDYASGRPVAALVYRHGLHIINVLQWPTSEVGDTQPKFSERRGYQIFKWQRSGMNYWVISDLNAADLQKFTSLWIGE